MAGTHGTSSLPEETTSCRMLGPYCAMISSATIILLLTCLHRARCFRVPSRASVTGHRHRNHRHFHQHRVVLSSSSSPNDDLSKFQLFDGETDATLLRINFSLSSSTLEGASRAINALRTYTRGFPFAAHLPVQPLTYLPVRLSNGEEALKVSFLRKKTAEKDAMDGGIIFTVKNTGNNEGTVDGDDDGERQQVCLEAKRISQGQTISKVFSEKQVILAYLNGLDDRLGQDISVECGDIEIDSVFHLWMNV
eukprot:scaffold15773_cov193-Alexandrium_tamarense.AAC.5